MTQPTPDLVARLELDHQQFRARGEASLFGDAAREIRDLRSRLACVAEATYWDRPYDERIAAIRGMCDLTTNGMTPMAAEGPTAGGFSCSCGASDPDHCEVERRMNP